MSFEITYNMAVCSTVRSNWQHRKHPSCAITRVKPTAFEKCMSSQWRRNERDGVSNHQPHDCLLKRLFRRKSKKRSKLCVTGLVRGIHRWPVNFPHKRPTTRKMFPFDDVIMHWLRIHPITWKQHQMNTFLHILRNNVVTIITHSLALSSWLSGWIASTSRDALWFGKLLKLGATRNNVAEKVLKTPLFAPYF